MTAKVESFESRKRIKEQCSVPPDGMVLEAGVRARLSYQLAEDVPRFKSDARRHRT